MRANYRHEMRFSQEPALFEASDWVRDHLDLSNQFQVADCFEKQETATPLPFVCEFFTEGMMQEEEINLAFQNCHPEEESWNERQLEDIRKG